MCVEYNVYQPQHVSTTIYVNNTLCQQKCVSMCVNENLWVNNIVYVKHNACANSNVSQLQYVGDPQQDSLVDNNVRICRGSAKIQIYVRMCCLTWHTQ